MKSLGILLLAALCLSVTAQASRRHGGRPPSLYGRNRLADYHANQFGQQKQDEVSQRPLDNEEDYLHFPTPEVHTPKGTFLGLKEVVNGKEVYSFKGIPYAKPPVGGLRFKRPLAADKLVEPYEAKTLPNACPQTVPTVFPNFGGEQMWSPNTNLSEDCLYLNIWVPAKVFQDSNDNEKERVPVIFWIYGGGFFSGSNSLDVYDGKVLAATQDVVVVSAQYRLGPLGFLFFGTDEAPGNMGLIDQALALQWTRDNIEYFGGNPNAITAAGESAGSASVGHHLLSPISKGYVKRAIMMSGLPTATYAWKSPDVMKANSHTFARNAGCNQKDITEIVECLRGIDSEKLIALQWKQYKNILDFPFRPTTDNYFLTDCPEAVIQKGKGKRADLMIGSVEDEGTYFILYHYLKYLHHQKPTSIPYDRFVDMMNEVFSDFNDNQKEAIISEYTHWENPEDGYVNLHNLGEAVGNRWFTCPNRKFADSWSNRGLSVYYYHLTERYTANPWAKWMGVMHADDIPIFFGAPLIANETWTVAEQQMTLNFMRLVGDFAKTGVPSPNWKRYTSEHPVYLDVNATKISEATSSENLGPKGNECAFWNILLPLIKGDEGSQVSRWNNMGEGIHGGRGFQVVDDHDHHHGHQHCSAGAAAQQNNACPQQQRFGGGWNRRGNRQTETSCRCSVEEGPTSTQDDDESARPFDGF